MLGEKRKACYLLTFLHARKRNQRKRKTAKTRSLQNLNLSPTISRAARKNKITLLRIIPTMTSMRFATAKPPGILSGISSGILSGKHSGTLSGISSGILSDIPSGVLSGISSGILSGISYGILSGKHSGTLSGISSGILSDIPSGVLSGISFGILFGRWGPAVLTELKRSQVAVQRCSLSSEGPGSGPAVLTELGGSQVEVQRCSLSSEVGEELARRRWTDAEMVEEAEEAAEEEEDS